MTDRRLAVAEPPAVRRFVVTLIAPRRRRIALTVVTFIAATALELAGPALLGVVVDEVSTGGTRSVIDQVVLALLAVTLGAAGLAWLGAVLAAAVGEDVLAELRHRVFDRAIDLPLETLEQAGTGDLLSRVTGDVAALSAAVRRSLPAVVIAGLQVVLTGVALVLLSPPLAGATLVAVPVVVVASRWYLHRAGGVYRSERERSAELTGALHESFEGAATVRAFGLGADQLARLTAAGATAFSAAMAGVKLRNVLRPAVVAGQFAALVAVIVVGARLVDDGAASLGVVTAAALYLLRLFGPISRLLEQLDELQTAQAALARLVGVIETPIPAAPRYPRLPSDGAVGMRGLRFSYEAGPAVLRGINLEVAAGERIALVGPSGAGKTTIAKLVAGIHQASGGTITIGGAPVDRIDPSVLRRHVALVTQEHHVFVGTLADNLRLAGVRAGSGGGTETAPPDDAARGDADLDRALAVVGATEWVRALPAGLDTSVGVGGHQLTPNQAQQVALARLVLADPAVVVLDEPTVAFDPTVARTVERALDAALAGRTVIAIAHRLHHAARLDRIAVVEAGRITESGTHTELLAAAGSYAALWARWQRHRVTATGRSRP